MLGVGPSARTRRSPERRPDLAPGRAAREAPHRRDRPAAARTDPPPRPGQAHARPSPCSPRPRRRSAPEAAQIVTVPENILDLHHAGSLHRAPAFSIRSSDRSGRVGRESAPRTAPWPPPGNGRSGQVQGLGPDGQMLRNRGQVRQEFANGWRCHPANAARDIDHRPIQMVAFIVTTVEPRYLGVQRRPPNQRAPRGSGVAGDGVRNDHAGTGGSGGPRARLSPRTP